MNKRKKKMIALFMGAVKSTDIHSLKHVPVPVTLILSKKIKFFPYIEIEEMRYDQSWNWLMPVCKKLRESTPPSGAEGLWKNDFAILERAMLDVNIKKTFEAVADIIEFYELHVKHKNLSLSLKDHKKSSDFFKQKLEKRTIQKIENEIIMGAESMHEHYMKVLNQELKKRDMRDVGPMEANKYLVEGLSVGEAIELISKQ